MKLSIEGTTLIYKQRHYEKPGIVGNLQGKKGRNMPQLLEELHQSLVQEREPRHAATPKSVITTRIQEYNGFKLIICFLLK